MARLEKREQEIIRREEALSIERRSLVELKQRVEIEQSATKNEHEDIKQKLLDIEHANNAIHKEKERLSQLYFELHALDGKNTGRLQQLQQSIQTLRQQEEHMSEVFYCLSRHPYHTKHSFLSSNIPEWLMIDRIVLISVQVLHLVHNLR